MSLLVCTDQENLTETLERGTFVRMDDGSIARRIVVISSATALDCDDEPLGTETLKRGSIVRVGTNQYAIQVLDVTP